MTFDIHTIILRKAEIQWLADDMQDKADDYHMKTGKPIDEQLKKIDIIRKHMVFLTLLCAEVEYLQIN